MRPASQVILLSIDWRCGRQLMILDSVLRGPDRASSFLLVPLLRAAVTSA
jgi:hypothetical protein